MALIFDGTLRLGNWSPPSVYVFMPRHRPGDFYQFGGGALITTPRATEALEEFLEMAGELLPLPYDGTNYTILNVTEVINCLDREQTEWQRGADGAPIWIKRFVFHRDRFTQSPLFKIPETSRSSILVVEGLRAPHEEFRFTVTRAGLSGLVFRELWNDED
jgi:hypothetical protein